MTDQVPTLCIYHAPCADGYGAAWAVWKRFGDAVKFHPAKHGEAPPDVTGEHVVIVDFSYPLSTLRAMAETAASILILDHHHTAQRDLEGLPACRPTWEEHLEDAALYLNGGGGNRIGARFDMLRSGAMMTWNYFHPGTRAPRLIRHIQDRDLWMFCLIGTREIQSWLFSFPYDFKVWSNLADELEDDESWRGVFEQGVALERKHQKDVGELLKETMRFMVIGGHPVPVANLPYTMASDGAGALAEAHTFGASYFDASNGDRVFSLRSRGDFDVGTLAQEMGRRLGTTGGGHKNAAGFRAPRGWEGE